MDAEYTDLQILEVSEDSDEDSESFEKNLITAIRDRPCLWDQRMDLRLRGIHTTKQAWKEISEILNTDPKLAQNKWKNLRDTFRRKYQEQKSYDPGRDEAEKREVQWKFYQPMEFLLPTIGYRKTFGNCSDAAENSESCEEILITAVRDRPCLWDHRMNVRLRGSNAMKQAWNEVSEILNADPKLVQRKWKNLRDTFRRKHHERKSNSLLSRSDASKGPGQWKFYQQMEFLLAAIEYPKTFSNCSNVNSSADRTKLRTHSLMVTTTLLPQSQPSERIVLQRAPSMKSTPSPTRIRVMTPPLNSPTTPLSVSPAPSTSSDVQDSRRQSSTRDSNKRKRTREDENSNNELTLISQKPSEEQAFCNYLQCRLEKLERKYFAKITNTILLEIMKVEEEQE